MRRIVHISDLHFGAADEGVAERLGESVRDLQPHLVVVSGDLTQRARRAQFRQAQGFLTRLPVPQIVVPGNHDVPLYNVYERFVNGLEKFQEFICEDLAPFYSDDELAVAGVNTARSLTFKGGRISADQIEAVRARMCAVAEKALKIVVTHHPFDVPDGEDESSIVGRARKAMPAIASCGADVFLSGHLHLSHIGYSARRYRFDNGYSALIIQAGTACSNRERGEENSFNVLEFDHPVLTVHRYHCVVATEGFRLAATERFAHDGRGWARL